MKAIKHRTIHPNATIRQALEALNQSGGPMTVLVVDEEGRLCGSVTDGDIRRAILSGVTMETSVALAMNPAPRRLVQGQEAIGLIKELTAIGIRSLPIVDHEQRLLRVVDLATIDSVLPLRALIMAGGRGMRLKPYTDSLPKPLIPVRGRPIIEHALELMGRSGIEDVSISVNYLREMIMDHLGDGRHYGLRLSYLEEDTPLGTAGALAMLRERGPGHVLMMNSDLLTDIDLAAMYTLFKERDADLVLATTAHVVDLPYAVMDLDEDTVLALREKPSLSFPCNAGIYMIHDRALAQVPEGRPYQATELLQDILDRKGRVHAFPIEGYWFDIGRHDDLQRAGMHDGSPR
jgi:dTDP-glucose pyrophosphorylase